MRDRTVILTLKQEWLRRVPVIRGLGNLRQLRDSVAEPLRCMAQALYLGGAVPAVTYREERWQRPDPAAKEVPRSH